MDKVAGVAERTGRKKAAGAWVRSRFLHKQVLCVVWTSVLFGVMCGWMARDIVSATGLVAPLGITLLIVPVLCVLATVSVYRHMISVEKRWGAGLDAERAVGDVIEYALAQDGCAFAHNIESLSAGGDVDHVAYVPGRAYVIETKARRVPKNLYRATLERLCVQARSVRNALGPGADVRPVLVIVDAGRMNPESTASVGGESVLVTTRKAFAKRLIEERRRAQRKTVTDPHRVDARKVWAFGSVRP